MKVAADGANTIGSQPLPNRCDSPRGRAAYLGNGGGTELVRLTIRDRSREVPWGHGPFNPATRTVTVSAYCPQCGGKRGAPQGLNQYDDGVWYWVQVWDSPCGHVDMYGDVAREAETYDTAAGRA